jgi:hypothetical protein
MTARASKVFPRPTLSAMMQPPKRLQLVDGADHAVALELEQLLPDHRVADAGGRLDDALLVHLGNDIELPVFLQFRIEQVDDAINA